MSNNFPRRCFVHLEQVKNGGLIQEIFFSLSALLSLGNTATKFMMIVLGDVLIKEITFIFYLNLYPKQNKTKKENISIQWKSFKGNFWFSRQLKPVTKTSQKPFIINYCAQTWDQNIQIKTSYVKTKRWD